MTHDVQEQVAYLDRLSNDVLQIILDFAMIQNSPFYLDDIFRGMVHNFLVRESVTFHLVSSTSETDPLFLHYKGDGPVHKRALQSVHLHDWTVINSTSRRIRAIGKVSFFRSKTIAIRSDIPGRLQRKDFTSIKHMLPHDQMLARSCIRDIIIVDAVESNPTTFLELPQKMVVFPALRHCTLLYGFTAGPVHRDHMEWITLAFALSDPAPLQMQELMYNIGMARNVQLGEAVGPGTNWEIHRGILEKYIYPTLKIKCQMLQAKQERRMPVEY